MGTNESDNTKLNGEPDRLKLFDEFYTNTLKPKLLDEYKPEPDCIRKTCNRFAGMLDYNVPHGKKNRGMCVYESFLRLIDSGAVKLEADQTRDELVEQAKALGWCIEIVISLLISRF